MEVSVHRQVITLDGIPLYNMTISAPNPWKTDYMYSGARRFDYSYRQDEPTTISFYVQGSGHTVAYLMQALSDQCGWHFLTLGIGYVCPYCGQYNPAGKIGCWSCGGEVERVPFIKPVQWPQTWLSHSYMDDITAEYGEPLVSGFELVSYGLDAEKHIRPLMESCTLETLHHGLHMTGYYLCEFCGSSVEEDRPCPYCGGYQLPWSELVKIDRECLYCGNRVESGVVCNACGAKLSGLTYAATKAIH